MNRNLTINRGDSSPAPTRERAVPGALNHLQQRLEKLGAAIDELETRLSPALAQQPPTDVKADAPQAPRCEIEAAVNDAAFRVITCISRLEALTARLEV